MLWILKPCLLIASSIIWINPAFSSNPCQAIIKKGVLTLKRVEEFEKIQWCECADFTKVVFKKIHVSSIPLCLSANENITSLSFSKTQIQRLPQGIENLTNLESLNLSFTKMVFLSEEIQKLTHLKFLNLRGTEITVLPPGLEHLETIDMRMIEMTGAEQELLRNQYPEVKIYFSSPCNCD